MLASETPYGLAPPATRQLGNTCPRYFQYNGDGLRVSQTLGWFATDYVWDAAAGLPVVLQEGTNTYVYGLDLISATDGGGVQTYYLYDGLGSTTDLTDGNGNVIATYGYDVFGELRSGTPGATDWLFTGEQRDSDSSLYYLRARYYDPSIGRFLSQDPVLAMAGLPQSLNRYVYGLNDPVNLIDPYGLFGFPKIPNPVDAVKDTARAVERGARAAGQAAHQVARSAVSTGIYRCGVRGRVRWPVHSVVA